MSTLDEIPNVSLISDSLVSLAGNLYREMLHYTENKNMGVCPMALSSILSLVSFGARDDTAQEIRKAILLPLNPDGVELLIKAVTPMLRKGKNFYYKSAKKIYLKSIYPIRKDYKTIANEIYDIDLEHLDFHQPPETAETINSFVESETQKEVTHLVQGADIDSTSQMLLVCGDVLRLHLSKFQKDANVKRPFNISAEKSVPLEFVEKNHIYNYCEIAEMKAKILEIPIETNLLDLVIILPDELDGLAVVEGGIESIFLKQKFVEQRVNVMIPKFRIECSSPLRKVFQRLGMKKAFTPEADLNGIIAEKQDLCINNLLHKTVVIFDDELGASGCIKPVGSVKKMPAASKSFIADRPFIFYVKLKNLIIFAGRIKNPTQYC